MALCHGLPLWCTCGRNLSACEEHTIVGKNIVDVGLLPSGTLWTLKCGHCKLFVNLKGPLGSSDVKKLSWENFPASIAAPVP